MMGKGYWWVICLLVVCTGGIGMPQIYQTGVNQHLNTVGETIMANQVGNFTSMWNTSLTSDGSSGADQIQLPLTAAGTYNFTISWGDGSLENITTDAALHSYAIPGTYAISINGTISGWAFNNTGDRLKLLEISNWGPLQLGNTGSYFYGASNMALTATDTPNLSGTTTLHNAFKDCTRIGTVGSINGWNVSEVVDMSGAFDNASSFNMQVVNWNVSSVTNMTAMFRSVRLFVSIYDDLLSAWAQLPLQNGVNFDAGESHYSPQAAEAHQILNTTFSWIILDLGMATVPSAPQNLNYFPSESGFKLWWGKPVSNGGLPIIEYHLYRSYDGNDFTLLTRTTELTVDDSTFAPRNHYWYNVTAVNEVGESAPASNDFPYIGGGPRNGSSPPPATYIYTPPPRNSTSSFYSRSYDQQTLKIPSFLVFSTIFSVMMIMWLKNRKRSGNRL